MNCRRPATNGTQGGGDALLHRTAHRLPDVHFDLQNIVIGPQGVLGRGPVTGTHQAEWLGIAPTGEPVDFYVTILFPWDSAARSSAGNGCTFMAMTVSSSSRRRARHA
ncbi:MAG: ester cyclase [Ardenticatenales bacterium]|nr:ester cyclase [Ardenticatenales bacterium]